MTGDYLSFFLMPFRHENPVDLKRLELIIEICDAAQRKMELEKSTLAKFKRVSENRLAEALMQKEGEPQQATDGRPISDEDILEPHPTIAKERIKPMQEHPLYRLVEKFVETQRDSNDCPFFVSLSGGVDSMVLMTLLCKLSQGKKIVACHVNYGNRREADAEADFVRRYCEKLFVTFHCVRVAELGLLRGVTEREK